MLVDAASQARTVTRSHWVLSAPDEALIVIPFPVSIVVYRALLQYRAAEGVDEARVVSEALTAWLAGHGVNVGDYKVLGVVGSSSESAPAPAKSGRKRPWKRRIKGGSKRENEEVGRLVAKELATQVPGPPPSAAAPEVPAALERRMGTEQKVRWSEAMGRWEKVSPPGTYLRRRGERAGEVWTPPVAPGVGGKSEETR